MHKSANLLFLAVIGCGDDPAPAGADAAVAADAAAAADAAVPPMGNGYELDGVRHTPTLVQCVGGVIAGSSADRTGFQFTFQGAPMPGSYTAEDAPNGGSPPASATGVVVNFSQQVQGGNDLHYIAQQGTVTVSSVGGKLRAVIGVVPGKDPGTMMTGQIAGDLSCP